MWVHHHVRDTEVEQGIQASSSGNLVSFQWSSVWCCGSTPLQPWTIFCRCAVARSMYMVFRSDRVTSLSESGTGTSATTNGFGRVLSHRSAAGGVMSYGDGDERNGGELHHQQRPGRDGHGLPSCGGQAAGDPLIAEVCRRRHVTRQAAAEVIERALEIGNLLPGRLVRHHQQRRRQQQPGPAEVPDPASRSDAHPAPGGTPRN